MSPTTSWAGWPCIPGTRPGWPRPADRRPGSARRRNPHPGSAWATGSWPWWATPPAAQTGVQLLDPLAYGSLSATSPRTYADSAALTRILLDAGRHADAESVVARLEDFATLHPDFPFLDCAALHARSVLDGDPD